MNKVKYTIITCFFLIPVLVTGQTKKKVVTSASMLYDMTQNIAGDQLEIELIVPIGGDPHLHEPTPRDAKMVAAADLIIVNGLTFEGWLDELIENSGTNATVVTVTEGINPITSLTYENSSDPHAWMDLQNGIKYIENIKDALTSLNPDNAEVYEFNYNVYKGQLEELDAYILKEIKTIPKEKRILITSHDAFQYYGKRYGIELESILGTSTDAQVQTSDIIRLNKIIKEKKIPAVFIESTINPKLLKQIAKDNDVVIGGELYADSIGGEDSPAPSYYDMLKHNTDVIIKALTRKISSDNLAEPSSEKSNWILWLLIGTLFIGGFIFVLLRLRK